MSMDVPQYDYDVLERSRHSQGADELRRELRKLGSEGWLLVTESNNGDLIFVRPVPQAAENQATRMVFTIRTGADMAVILTVDTTNGLADVQFTDDHGDKVEGPLDSVTDAPIVPAFTSDNTAVLTVGTATEDPAQVGHWTAPLSEVSAGSANVQPVALTNSDGSAVVEPEGTANAGQPFAVPDAVNVTVNPGAAAGEVFTVTGS